MINRFRMEDVEEKERKFIFSYGVGETTVETKEGSLVIPNVLKYMFDDGRKAVDVQGDSTMTEEDSGSLISKHNQFLDMITIIDPKEECMLIKCIEDLKMDKEDVQDYIDDELTELNGIYNAHEEGTAHVKDPLGYAGMSVEIGSALEGTPKKTAQFRVKMESNMEDIADEKEQGSTSSSDDFIVIT
ncbi:hypothetical protein Tco_0692660 [Tanacetum coccineum]